MPNFIQLQFFNMYNSIPKMYKHVPKNKNICTEKYQKPPFAHTKFTLQSLEYEGEKEKKG